MGALRKAGVWLGLVEDDDDRSYDEEHVRERELVRRDVQLGLIALIWDEPSDVAHYANDGKPPRLGIQFPGNRGSMIRGPNATADGCFVRPESPRHRVVDDGDTVGLQRSRKLTHGSSPKSDHPHSG